METSYKGIFLEHALVKGSQMRTNNGNVQDVPDVKLSVTQFMALCSDVGLRSVRGLRPEVLQAIYQKHKPVHEIGLPYAQFNLALQEAMDIAGLGQQELLSRKDRSNSAHAGLVPTARLSGLENLSTQQSGRDSGRPMSQGGMRQEQAIIDNGRLSSGILQYMQGVMGPQKVQDQSGKRSARRAPGTAPSGSLYGLNGTTNHGGGGGEDRFERIVDRLETMQAVRQQQRQEDDVQYGNAALLIMISELSQRVQELEVGSSMGKDLGVKVARLDARQDQADMTANDHENRLAIISVRLEELDKTSDSLGKGLQALLRGATEAKSARAVQAAEIKSLTEKQNDHAEALDSLTADLKKIGVQSVENQQQSAKTSSSLQKNITELEILLREQEETMHQKLDQIQLSQISETSALKEDIMTTISAIEEAVTAVGNSTADASLVASETDTRLQAMSIQHSDQLESFEAKLRTVESQLSEEIASLKSEMQQELEKSKVDLEMKAKSERSLLQAELEALQLKVKTFNEELCSVKQVYEKTPVVKREPQENPSNVSEPLLQNDRLQSQEGSDEALPSWAKLEKWLTLNLEQKQAEWNCSLEALESKITQLLHNMPTTPSTPFIGNSQMVNNQPWLTEQIQEAKNMANQAVKLCQEELLKYRVAFDTAQKQPRSIDPGDAMSQILPKVDQTAESLATLMSQVLKNNRQLEAVSEELKKQSNELQQIKQAMGELCQQTNSDEEGSMKTQIVLFEHKIATTLQTMHQHHLKKGADWEAKLAMQQDQVKQISVLSSALAEVQAHIKALQDQMQAKDNRAEGDEIAKRAKDIYARLAKLEDMNVELQDEFSSFFSGKEVKIVAAPRIPSSSGAPPVPPQFEL